MQRRGERKSLFRGGANSSTTHVDAVVDAPRDAGSIPAASTIGASVSLADTDCSEPPEAPFLTGLLLFLARFELRLSVPATVLFCPSKTPGVLPISSLVSD